MFRAAYDLALSVIKENFMLYLFAALVGAYIGGMYGLYVSINQIQSDPFYNGTRIIVDTK